LRTASLFPERGTEVRISPLLEGIRTLSGEKIQWYLASELRDRIRSSELRISIMDKLVRKQLEVEPRQFDGRLLHQFARSWRMVPLTRLAKEQQIVLRTARRWVERYRKSGLAGLVRKERNDRTNAGCCLSSRK
jgi:hypothetical protein